jgi:hypothetical protein
MKVIQEEEDMWTIIVNGIMEILDKWEIPRRYIWWAANNVVKRDTSLGDVGNQEWTRRKKNDR